MNTDVVIYVRVSTKIQDYENQITALKEVCERDNYNLKGVFKEKISGARARKERIELNNMLQYVEENSIKGILVSEFSRLGRNNVDVLSIIKKLNDLKIWVYSKQNGIKTLNDDGSSNQNTSLLINFLTGIADWEKNTIHARSIQGLQQSVLSQKRWTGGSILPYGYKRVNKQLEIDEEESEIIKLIFNNYLEGEGTQKIADTLNKDGIKTKYNKVLKKDFEITYRKGHDKEGEIKEKRNKDDFKWKDGTIYNILTNEVYIGKKKGKGILKDIILYSPPIIDEEVFNKVQIKLKEKNVKRKTKFFYLFKNKLNCGRCGRTYHAHKRMPKEEGKASKDSRYICLSKRYKEVCDNYGIGISKINDGVWSVLRHNQNEIENIIKLNSSDIYSIKEEILNLNEELEKQKNNLSKLRKNENVLLDYVLDELIDKPTFIKRKKKIDEEKNILENKINDIEITIINKRDFVKKRNNANYLIRSIKESRRELKKTIKNVIREMKIYPVFKHNLDEYVKLVKGDKFVFVELYTYLNENTPLVFCVSQRSKFIVSPKLNEYRKEDCFLKIGGFDEVEGEEEAADVSIRNLYHLSILD